MSATGVAPVETEERGRRTAGATTTAAAKSAVPTRWLWLAAWPVNAVFILSNAATPLYVLWQHDIGFSKGTMTVVFAFYIVGLIGSLLVSGVVSDRVGRKPVLLPALVLGLAACLTFGTASSVAALIVARLLTGIAVFAPGITATSFVLSLGPSLLSGLLGTTNRIIAGAMAFVMFIAATGVQFAVQRLRRRTILVAGAASTTLSMVALVLAVRFEAIVPLIAAALLAGAGQGLGQLGGLSLLNHTIAPKRLAEANAALNVGGYVLAGILPVSAGYLSDAVGLTNGATIFGAVLTALAVIGGLVVLATKHHVTDPA